MFIEVVPTDPTEKAILVNIDALVKIVPHPADDKFTYLYFREGAEGEMLVETSYTDIRRTLGFS